MVYLNHLAIPIAFDNLVMLYEQIHLNPFLISIILVLEFFSRIVIGPSPNGLNIFEIAAKILRFVTFHASAFSQNSFKYLTPFH